MPINAITFKSSAGIDSRSGLSVGSNGVQSLTPARIGSEGLAYDLGRSGPDCVVVKRSIHIPGQKPKTSVRAVPMANIAEIDYGEET